MKKNKAILLVLACSMAIGTCAPTAYAVGAGTPPLESAANENFAESIATDTEKLSRVGTESGGTDSAAKNAIQTPDDGTTQIDIPAHAESGKSSRSEESAAAVKGTGIKEGVDSFMERVLYTTYDKDADPKQHLQNEVTIDGVVYQLKTTGTPIYITKEDIVPDRAAYESEVFTGNGDEHLPDETIVRNEITYKLVSKELVEQKAEERSEYKETVVEYKGVESGIVLPTEKELTFTDADTGQEITATLPRVREQLVAERWSEDFTFPIVIDNYNADILVLNGKEMPKDAELIDYADDFLEMLRLDPEAYRVSSIEWDGAPYEEGGVSKRKATANGSKYVKDINVVYGGTVTLPSITGKVWSCIYEEAIPDGQKTVYTMAVDATYGTAVETVEVTADGGLFDKLVGYVTAAYEAVVEAFKEHPVISSIPLVAVAALIAFFVTKKVQNRCIYDKNIKCPHKKRTKETCQSCVHYRNRQKI